MNTDDYGYHLLYFPEKGVQIYCYYFLVQEKKEKNSFKIDPGNFR